MIDPSKLSPEELAAVKAYNEEQFQIHLNSAHAAAFHHLERLAETLEAEATRIREVLGGRAAYPKRP